jgi:hypothetical protein
MAPFYPSVLMKVGTLEAAAESRTSMRPYCEGGTGKVQPSVSV